MISSTSIIPEKIGEYHSNFTYLPDDVLLLNIFNRLQLFCALQCREVCWRWKVCIDNGQFLRATYPHLHFYASGLRMNGSQFVTLANRFNELRTLDLRNCRTLTDNDLKSLTCKFNTLRLGMNPRVTEVGVCTLIKQFTKPNTLQIDHSTSIDISKIFSVLVENQISLKELYLSSASAPAHKLHEPNQNVPTNNISEEFCAFIRTKGSGGLNSPATLALSGKELANLDVCSALVDKKVKLNSLNTSESLFNDRHLLHLINNDVFCGHDLFDSHFILTGEIVDALLAKNIKLKSLVLFSDSVIDDDKWIEFIDKGLISPCKLSICYSRLNPKISRALTKAQIKINSLTIDFNLNNPNEDCQEGFKNLCANGHFAETFSLAIIERDQASKPAFLFSPLVNPRWKINELDLQSEHFSHTYFSEMCKEKIFVKDFKLQIENCGRFATPILYALQQANLTFSTFSFNSLLDCDISPLILSHALNECHTIKLPTHIKKVEAILIKLATLPVVHLKCHLESKRHRELLITLLKDKNNFRKLNELSITENFSKEHLEEISKLPHITVILNPVPVEEDNEDF